MRSRQQQLADEVAAFVAQSESITFVELARFLKSRGVASRGEVNLCMAADRNVLVWSGMSETMCAVVTRLLDERRVFAHRSSPVAYHAQGGVLTLPLADSPTRGGLREPHWLPVVLRPVPPRWALH